MVAGGPQVGAYGLVARAKMCRLVQKVAEKFGGFKNNAYLCIVQDKTPWPTRHEYNKEDYQGDRGSRLSARPTAGDDRHRRR